MSSVKSLLFSHNHHLLSVKGCEAGLDVLAFEGDEALSQPFRYRIEFTSADHAISKEMMLMKAASLTLQAPVAQGFGINVQQPVRVIQGVVTGFERLSTSRDETHYALTLQRSTARMTCALSPGCWVRWGSGFGLPPTRGCTSTSLSSATVSRAMRRG